MHTVALTWQQAATLAAVLLGVALLLYLGARVLPAGPARWARLLAPFLRECAMIAALYGLWQYAGSLAKGNASHAFDRARWVLHAEHDLRLPSEHDVQRLILGHRLLVQACNLYYDTMHFTMLFVFLLWLFWRHRDAYAGIRTTLAMTTGACLLVQLIPVAPPRLTPGFIDTARLYGQSVYGSFWNADQLSAMPSVHVAWAVLVGWFTFRVSDSRWRFIGPLHSVLTIFVVVATANHYWADGIVAVALLIACRYLQLACASLYHRVRALARPAVQEDRLSSGTFARILP